MQQEVYITGASTLSVRGQLVLPTVEAPMVYMTTFFATALIVGILFNVLRIVCVWQFSAHEALHAVVNIG